MLNALNALGWVETGTMGQSIASVLIAMGVALVIGWDAGLAPGADDHQAGLRGPSQADTDHHGRLHGHGRDHQGGVGPQPGD
jgi:hypothetical protein